MSSLVEAQQSQQHAASASSGTALAATLQASLSAWWASSQTEIARSASDALFYGVAYDAWGVQTQQKALSVAGFLALRGDALAKEQFLDLLRYNLRTHKSSTGVGNAWD